MKIICLTLLLLSPLIGCKSVIVNIPAAYPLSHIETLNIKPFTGPHGENLRGKLRALLRQHLPDITIQHDTHSLNAEADMIMECHIHSLNISEPIISWGYFDKQNHIQHGQVRRDGNISVTLTLLGDDQKELWSSHYRVNISESESLQISKNDDENDIAEDINEGKWLDALEDFISLGDPHEQAMAEAPSITLLQERVISQLAREISITFYDRQEKQWKSL